MAYDFAGGINQLRPVQLVDFFVEMAEGQRGGMKRVLSFMHRRGSRMIGLSVEFDAIIEHAQYTGDYADIVSCIFKDRSLFDMKLKHRRIVVRVQPVFGVSLYGLLSNASSKVLILSSTLFEASMVSFSNFPQITPDDIIAGG